MNRRKLLRLSLALNLAFILLGTIYLIRKIEFWTTHSVKAQRTVQSAGPPTEGDFVSTPEYRWQEGLFEEEPIQNGAVVFLGDSITAGGFWQYVWRGKAQQPILNRGLACDTMEGVIARIDEVMRHRPRKIFIMIGINDLRFQDDKPGDLLNQYKILLHKIDERQPEAQIYLQSLLPVWGETNKAVEEVNQGMSKLDDGKRVHYLDIHYLVTDSKGELGREWTFDGIHIRAAAYQKWRDSVWPLVN